MYVPDLPPRVILDYATKCNLTCGMCPVWGDTPIDSASVAGVMDLEKSRKILDELTNKPVIQPSLYGEPLLIPNLRQVIADLKSRGLTVAMNTNGLTLSQSLADYFVEWHVDSIMVSIDATTPETLFTVRSTRLLSRIEEAVRRLLATRRDALYPRIGVSFTVQAANQHEEQEFVQRWVSVVDVVRVGLVFEHGTFTQMHPPEKRIPCPVLYTTMPIHNDGTVTLCCLDSHRATNMGNVFTEGVKAVWHGKAFTELRQIHEAGRWEDAPLCTRCNGWAVYDFTEEVKDGLLIRRSPQYVYYNKLTRLVSWNHPMKAGHYP